MDKGAKSLSLSFKVSFGMKITGIHKKSQKKTTEPKEIIGDKEDSL